MNGLGHCLVPTQLLIKSMNDGQIRAMGFQPWVPQQDSNWEIRVTMLLSLFLQALLIFLGPMRKRTSAPFWRFAIWSCYLLADWVADLALGLLLNNMGNIGGGGGDSSASSFGFMRGVTSTASSNDNSNIFAFWTPFLLLHLGGPDTITAYSLEDNELWFRHLIGLLFELFSAFVIFYCSLHSNPMIPGTILMFVVGIIKYGERTYSLYCGSIESFRANILGPPEPGLNYAKLMTVFSGKEKAGLVVEIAITNGEAKKAQEAAEQEVTNKKSLEARAYEFFCIFRRLFVDLSLSSQERRMVQAFFLERTDLRPSEAFEVIELELNFAYDMMYTKAPVTHTKAGWVLRLICSGCLVSALLIFFRLDKSRHGMKHVDIGITYALLLGGLALDAMALLMLLFSNHVKVTLEQSRRFKWLARLTKKAWRWRLRQWSGTTSQMSLIGYCFSKPDHSVARCCLNITKMLRIEENVADFFFIRRFPLSKHDIEEGPYEGENSLLKFIFDDIKMAATGQIDHKVRMEFFNSRGEHAIERRRADIRMALGDDNTKFAVIMASVKERDFDESLLLWHIATDLCLLSNDKLGADAKDTPRMRLFGETLSEYMLYLLVKQSEIVVPKTGIWLMRYRDTCAAARQFFGRMATASWMTDRAADERGFQDSARRMLLSVNTSEKPALVKGDRSKSVLFDACILAKVLMELDHWGLRWEVIMGVWREMLTYTASKCRGTTHLRQLNRGGELITIVWFLMENMGLGDTYEAEAGAIAKIIVIDQ